LFDAAERGYLRAMQRLDSEELARLSPEERLALIGQLWDSLRDTEVPLPEAQQAELARRLSSLDQDRAHAVTWEQLRAELARRRP
jgi:putative addiction module component (TIGR02574 family)